MPGVEVSTGSLGHGLSIASGMALAAKRERSPARVFVVLSDGDALIADAPKDAEAAPAGGPGMDDEDMDY